MAFETFSLAEVLQNAELINQTRGRSNLDQLRGISTRENILTSRQGRRIAGAEEDRASAESRKKTQFDNTSFLVSATDQILASDDPVATARLMLPEAQRRGIVLEGVDVSDGLDLNEIKQINTRAKIALVKSELVGSAQERFFDSLTKDLLPTELRESRDIQLGRIPRAVGSAVITTAVTPGLTDLVATSESDIRERVKFGELTGASRSKVINEGFEFIRAIDKNILNLDKAIASIDEGASTGAIESRFAPTIRASTVKLEQTQKLLGLDVIGGVTFGALSKGELDLALEVALPTGLQPPELKQWLVDKIAAQTKLRAYYVDQIEFLHQGGSITEFVIEKERSNQRELPIPGPRALEHLRLNPETLTQFIEKFGENAVPAGPAR